MRVDGNTPPEKINMTSSKELMSRLRVGDHIHAKILDLTGDKLTLRMSDGTVFQASTKAMMPAASGDVLHFTVAQIDQQKIFLETVKPQSSLPEGSIDLLKFLQSLGLRDTVENKDIAKEMLNQKVNVSPQNVEQVKATSKLAGLDVVKSVFLLANGLTPEKNNIDNLTSLLEQRYSLSSRLEDLETLISKQLSPELQQKLSESLRSHSLQKLQALFFEVQTLLGNPAEQSLSSSTFTRQELTNLIQNLLENLQGSAFKNNSLAKSLVQKLQGQLDLVSKTFDSDENSLSLRNHFFTKLHTGMSAGELHIPTKYNDILTRLQLLKETLQTGNFSPDNEMFRQTQSLEDSLKFLKEINANQTFVPIPIQWEHKNTTGALYILRKDSKSKKIDPENTTMFLSLDTETMGQVDSLVSIQKKAIGLNVRLRDKDVIEHFKNHSKNLYQMLSDAGYSLVDVRYRILEENVNLINATSVMEKEAKSHAKFDFRV